MYRVVFLLATFTIPSLSIASSPKRPNYDARSEGEFFTQPPKQGSAEIILYDGSWEDGFATGYSPCAPNRTFLESFINDELKLLKKPCGKELYAYGEGGVEKVRLRSFKVSDHPGACGKPNKLVTARIEPLAKPAFFITSVAPGALASGKYVRAEENTSRTQQSNLELAFQKNFSRKGAILKAYSVPKRSGEFVVVTNKKAFYVDKGQWTEVTEPDEYRQFVPFKTIDGFFISNGKGYPYLILDNGFRLLVVRKGQWQVFYMPFYPPSGC